MRSPFPRVGRLVLVGSLALVAPLLALERGALVAVAAATAVLDLVLDWNRHRRGPRRLLAFRYAAIGPFALACLALSGAPGEAVVLACAWTLLCLVALSSLRAAVPLLAAAALLALTPRPETLPREEILRVATFNLEWAKSGPRPLLEAVRSLDADVVALQEVVDATGQMGTDIMAHLKRGTGMASACGLSWHDDHGSFGTGLLSRHPIAEVERLELPYVPSSHSVRVATKARLMVRGVPVTVVSAHLDRPPYASPRDNERQARALLQWVREEPLMVLCGDFNAFPAYPSYRLLSSSLVDARKRQRWPSGSWPAPIGCFRLDWIFVRGLQPVSQQIVRKSPTDHFPVVADLLLPPPSSPVY